MPDLNLRNMTEKNFGDSYKRITRLNRYIYFDF